MKKPAKAPAKAASKARAKVTSKTAKKAPAKKPAKAASKATAKTKAKAAPKRTTKATAKTAPRAAAKSTAKAPAKKAAAPSQLDRSIIHLLHRAGQCAGDIFAHEIAGGDLTPRQYAVLLVISKNDGISQTGLVNQTGVDRSTLADIMRRMQKKGLVKRTRTKTDARTYAVGLTAKGKKVLAKSAPAAKKADTKVLSALPVKDRPQLLSALERIVEKAESKPS